MLNNKVAFVTGAAQGIGYAISEEFAKQGANVVLADYNPKITDVAAELGQKYAGKTLGVVMNVMDNDSIQAGLDQTLAEFGQLDYVVNNAGGGVLKPFAELTDDDFDKTVNLDLRGTFKCMRAELKLFLKQGSGSIVNAGALGSIYNPGGMGAYNAAKNGIMGMTQAAAIDYADQNIRVNCVAPGLTKTPLNEGGFLEKILPTVPMKRAETAAEVAKVYVFVATEATFMTGQTILSDGGVSVGLK
ncbi:SDR family NAD(P)-dependent oxidoreductase [Loigolactobacillus bifermentans]|uniref:Short-chain dehydrogenase reductase SDR n=1 Tax=Loigolactobacillus bifermentans DSM 20003 TaxID=1423726 RepID=A0A0R1GET9_9LACO|nr:SDR family NAD(P)-dependent oxidoreductase [Loigolactobacillus bifermentans]KRK32560.1 short-chain dehydrogenase reductase SDR [Loigolactobacillus bifermentans DSM 20003]QGG60231.1 SDR family oxidoreductase [Loigolactobacillus bifermentans]